MFTNNDFKCDKDLPESRGRKHKHLREPISLSDVTKRNPFITSTKIKDRNLEIDTSPIRKCL